MVSGGTTSSRFYSVPGAHLVINLDKVISVSREGAAGPDRQAMSIKIQLTESIVSLLTFARIEDLERVERGLELALTGSAL